MAVGKLSVGKSESSGISEKERASAFQNYHLVSLQIVCRILKLKVNSLAKFGAGVYTKYHNLSTNVFRTFSK